MYNHILLHHVLSVSELQTLILVYPGAMAKVTLGSEGYWAEVCGYEHAVGIEGSLRLFILRDMLPLSNTQGVI